MMESTIEKIAFQLAKDPKILKGILTLAAHFGTEETERIILENDIRKGTIDYCNWLKKLLTGWISRNGLQTVGNLLKILNEMECRSVAEFLRENFTSNTPLSLHQDRKAFGTKPARKLWNILDPVPTFVGREKEILQLEGFLEDYRKRILVISGMGGQGKTQLCRKLITELHKKDNYPLIIWLAGESGQTLTSSIINWIRKMDGKNEESRIRKIEDAMDHILPLVEEEEKVLLIVDNVDTEYNEIEKMAKYILNNMRNFKILMTSRLRTLLTEDAEYLILQTLLPEAAYNLVRNGIRGNLVEAEVEKLCKEMGFHALALQLSVGFIRSQRICMAGGHEFGIKEFITHFNKDKKTILEKTEKLTEYEKNLFHHVKQCMPMLKKRKQNLAEEILLIFSLFRHDGVEMDFLIKTSSMISTEKKPSIRRTLLTVLSISQDSKSAADRLKEAVNLLHSLSLVDASSLEAVTIHPLIQETLRILFPSKCMELADTIFSKIEVGELSKANLSQVLRLWEIGSREDSLLQKHALLVRDIYNRLYDTSQIQVLVTFTNSHRENVLRTLENFKSRSEVVLAELYYGKACIATGDYQKGLGILEALQADVKKILGENVSSSIVIETELANALKMMNREEEAISLYESILTRCISKLGENHKTTIMMKHDYAVAHFDFGRNEEALKLFEEVLQWEVIQIGTTHPSTLLTRHSIACCHFEMGNMEKAGLEFKAILELSKSDLGELPITLINRGWVARIFAQAGEYEKARVEYERLIEDSKEVFDPEHQITLAFKHDHAFCLLKLGEIENAITEVEDVLVLKTQNLGQHHPLVETTRSLLHEAKEIKNGYKSRIEL